MYQLLYVSFIDQGFNRSLSNAFLDDFLENEICFVLTLGKDTSEKEFILMKRTINYIVGEYGCHSAKYCVVLHKDHERIGNINFKEGCTTEAALRERINALELPSSASSLLEDLVATQSVFMDQTLGKEAKKVRYTCAQPFSGALSSFASYLVPMGSFCSHGLLSDLG